MKRVAVVVLNWNSETDAINCIKSLTKQVGVKPDIILVDNNSTQESICTLDEFITTHPHLPIHFICNNKNSGYSGGNNIGFIYALHHQYDYIGTLNPDATAHPNWLKNLLDALDRFPSAGIATGMMLKANGKTIDTTGEVYSIWGIPGPRGRGRPVGEASTVEEFVFATTGGGFITRAELLQKVGLFDERFFMYFEDIDLSFRSQLMGYRVIYTPKARAYHKISASSNKVPGLAVKQTFKNLPLLFIKSVPFSLWGAILPRFILAYSLIFANAIVHSKGGSALVGWVASIALSPRAWKQRRSIQSNRVVTDDYIKSIMLHDIPPEQTGLTAFRSFFTKK